MTYLTLLGALLGLSSAVHADGIYTKSSPVLQISANSYDTLIAQSNHTSILEFYAPWCGHCQSLKPAYEKAAKNLAGLAKVAAINCDEDSNKNFCGQMGVKGFPTLKIVKPGSKPGRPLVEDYQGQRTAKAIVEAVVDKIPNHVKRLQGTGLDAWLADSTTKAKAIVFSEKGTTSALVKSIAVDFLGSIGVAQMRSKEDDAVKKFGVAKFPTIVLVPGNGEDPVLYTGDMKKEAVVAFLSQAATPNPDPAPKKGKGAKESKTKPTGTRGGKHNAAFSAASKAHMASDFEDFLGASTITLDDDTPTDSPLPIVDTEPTPAADIPESIPLIPVLSTPGELDRACLDSKSGTCILVLLPISPGSDAIPSEDVTKVLQGFGVIFEKHIRRGSKIFPFFGVPAENERSRTVRDELGLAKGTNLEVIAVNNKRGWWRQYTAADYESANLEGFVDAIILGEGAKQKLPENFGTQPLSEEQIVDLPPAPEPETEPEPESEIDPEPVSVPEPEPVESPDPIHNEL